MQDIQKKRDATNRSWQRIILRNIGKTVGWDFDSPDLAAFGGAAPPVVETRQLWWQVHRKMRSPEYSNMLLLQRVRESLETLMYERKQRYMTKRHYGQLIDKVHLDTEGHVVEPFVLLADREGRDPRRLFRRHRFTCGITAGFATVDPGGPPLPRARLALPHRRGGHRL